MKLEIEELEDVILFGNTVYPSIPGIDALGEVGSGFDFASVSGFSSGSPTGEPSSGPTSSPN